MLACLHDPSRGIRIAAIKALAVHATEETVQRIYVVARDDTDKKVRDIAATLLADCDGSGDMYARDLESREKETVESEVEDGGLTMLNEDLNKEA